MSEVRTRFRSDSWHFADEAARLERGLPLRWTLENRPDEFREVQTTPPARPGDLWRVRWATRYDAEHPEPGPIAGYAIGCPTCLEVHAWTTATNCSAARRPIEGMPGHSVCIHSGTGSCWNWTGSAEEGTLSASPSLYSVKELGGCGFHGFLTAGVLRG